MADRKHEKDVEFTAVIWEEERGFVSFCPELGVTSCGNSVEHAAAMLQEAVELYLENARALGVAEEGISGGRRGHRWTTSFRVAV